MRFRFQRFKSVFRRITESPFTAEIMSCSGVGDYTRTPNPTGSDDVGSTSIFSYLAELDRANGRCRKHIGHRFGGTPYIGTRRCRLSVLDPPCLDIFIPHHADTESTEEAVMDYNSEGRFANMKGFEVLDDGCIDMFHQPVRTIVIQTLPDEEEEDIIVDELPSVQDQPPEENDFDVNIAFEDLNVKSTTGGDPEQKGVEEGTPVYIPPPNAPALTEEMIKVNEGVLDREDKDLIREIGPHRLCRENLATLKPGEWLDDQVIDAYLELIKERNRQCGFDSLYTFRSSFYTLLGTAKGLDKVREAAEDDDIFSYDILLIPVCKSYHWRLIVVHVQAKTVLSYNSLNSPDVQIRNNIERFLIIEENRLATKKGVPLNPDAPAWMLIEEAVPRQENYHDCGVFVLQFANKVSRGQQIDFDQQNMDYFRELILYECVQGRLLL